MSTACAPVRYLFPFAFEFGASLFWIRAPTGLVCGVCVWFSTPSLREEYVQACVLLERGGSWCVCCAWPTVGGDGCNTIISCACNLCPEDARMRCVTERTERGCATGREQTDYFICLITLHKSGLEHKSVSTHLCRLCRRHVLLPDKALLPPDCHLSPRLPHQRRRGHGISQRRICPATARLCRWSRRLLVLWHLL